MKASKFSDAQEAFILTQGADRGPVAEICRRARIGQAKKYDGLLPTDMLRLKQLEDEKGKLRKLVADLSLDKEILQDVIRRKLCGPIANASWQRSFVWNGVYRSGGPGVLPSKFRLVGDLR